MIKRKSFGIKRTLKKSPTGAKKRRKRTPLTIAKEKLEEVQKELVIFLYGRDCYTCPQKNLTRMNCQLGHVPWPRPELSVRCVYDIKFTRIQCFRCNINCGGNGAKALVRMLREGINVDELEAQNLATKGKPTPLKWFHELTESYQKQLLELRQMHV